MKWIVPVFVLLAYDQTNPYKRYQYCSTTQSTEQEKDPDHKNKITNELANGAENGLAYGAGNGIAIRIENRILN